MQQVGFDPPIETEYHQVAILKNAPDMKPAGCACIDSVTATYFRSDGGDKFLIATSTASGPPIRTIFRSESRKRISKKSSSAPADGSRN